MPNISVIMPVYNGAIYIGEAIESLLAQSVKDWELIVIDDGSTDDTAEVAARYAALDKRIRYKYQTHGGEAVARNLGLELAEGEYIVSLDADDWLLPNSFEVHRSFLESNANIGVAYSDGYFCDMSGHPLAKLSQHRPGVFTGNILEPLVLDASVLGASHCAMARHSCIEQHHLRFDEQLVIGPDWDFWIQLAEHTSFGYVDDVTCMYRIHDLNISFTVPQGKRLQSLILNRLKVLNASYFLTLSMTAKSRFFYQLLVVYLKDDPATQEEIMRSNRFRHLPVEEQARLMRYVAIEHVIRNTHLDMAHAYLVKANQLAPTGLKQQLVYRLFLFTPSLARAAVLFWRHLRQRLFQKKMILSPFDYEVHAQKSRLITRST